MTTTDMYVLIENFGISGISDVNTDINKMIERIDEIDRKWAGGGNFFSRGLYYIAIPERFGGSKERAAQEFSEAVQIGPNYLVNRWGRAKYLYQLLGDEVHFRSGQGLREKFIHQHIVNVPFL